VAAHVVQDLGADYELVLMSRQQSAAERASAVRGRFLHGDSTSVDDCLRAAEGVEAIVHLAAVSIASEATFRVNVLSTYAVLEAARQSGVGRIVMASSNCAMGHCFRTSGRPFEIHYLPLDEEHPSQVEDSYGLSKIVGEKMLETYSNAFGIEAIALRPAWCWGLNERAERLSGVFDAARGARGFWAYIDMRDAANAFRLALEAKPRHNPWWGAFFISAADTTAEEDSRDLFARFYPEYAELASGLNGRVSFFSSNAAARELGFAARFSWRDKNGSRE
jgi:nucleoside-diphosphate-sugar epimerase